MVLNPVRAGLVTAADEWPWSSYRAVMGKAAAADWLALDDTLKLLHAERGPARRAYARFVHVGVQNPNPGFGEQWNSEPT
ncbi:MAG: hypothetical protein KGJ32_07455 [Xanthomonadaceae bacterium]|nr:hypothetical protein [Xanthomonadaceae bacterium]